MEKFEFNKYNKYYFKNVFIKYKLELVSFMGCCVLGMKDDVEFKVVSFCEVINRIDSKFVNRVCFIILVGGWGR